MSYCNNCGSIMTEGTRFCSNCGADSGLATQPVKSHSQPEYSAPQQHSGPYQQPAYAQPIQGAHLSRKTPVVAVLLSMFVMLGSGQMYAGKVGRGFAFIGGIVSLGVLIVILVLTTYDPFIVFWIIPVVFAVQLWCVIDAYVQVRKYNSFIDTHGRVPTSGDKW